MQLFVQPAGGQELAEEAEAVEARFLQADFQPGLASQENDYRCRTQPAYH